MTQPPVCAEMPLIDQEGRQMHGDESKLEAAGEEAEHQQHVRAVTKSLSERLGEGLLIRRRLAR